MSMKQYCPNCNGELISESLGWKCSKCKGFIDVNGNFHKYVERPFMPPKTNFDKITENEGTLAKFIIDTVSKCQFNNCEDCPLYEVDGCSRQEKVKEWLQQEIDDEDIKEK